MKSFKLIISLALVIAMVLSFAIPVSATASSHVCNSFWQFLENGFNGTQFNDFIHNLSDSWDTLTDSEKQTAYNNYVGTLPGNGFGRDSSGSASLYWTPNVMLLPTSSNVPYGVSNPGIVCRPSAWSKPSAGAPTSAEVDTAAVVNAPYTGIYYYCSSFAFSSAYYNQNVNDLASTINGKHFTAGSQLISKYHQLAHGFYTATDNIPSCSAISCNVRFRIVTTDTSVTTIYTDNSRVNTTVNNYSYTTNEGDTYNFIINTPIFDETTLIFTNPITGVSVNIQDWWYDYCTRTYNLSYNDNDVTIKPTVQFGDSDITVTVGNDTYTYYYTVPDTSCDHTYVVSNSLDPTCTATGSKTYSCSKCQDTYTEVIPALGHEWVLGETVATTYNDDETVNQQGYTLYTCSRCGLEYYDYDGTGPPANDSEVVEDLNWLQRIYYKLCDILKAILGIDTTPEITIDTATGTDIIVNVPGEDGEDDQQFSIKDFKEKFAWIGEVYNIFTAFVDDITADNAQAYALASNDDVMLMSDDGSASFSSGSTVDVGSSRNAPSFTIDFGAANSHYGYNYGGTAELLDLSWYTQYKPTVDGILSGFLWLFFIWRLFKSAPDILNGAGIETEEPYRPNVGPIADTKRLPGRRW